MKIGRLAPHLLGAYLQQPRIEHLLHFFLCQYLILLNYWRICAFRFPFSQSHYLFSQFNDFLFVPHLRILGKQHFEAEPLSFHVLSRMVDV